MGKQTIHKTAIVDPDATLGDDVSVGPHTIVEADCEIGDGTRIDANVKIGSGARIGKNCHIFHGAVISELPQDLKFKGEKTTVVVGDRAKIREYVTVHRGTEQKKETVVGSDSLLMAYVHIAHDCSVGDHVILANGVTLGGHVELDDYVYIGGLVGLHQFTHVGENAFIGGGYRCVQDVPPYILAAGEPLRFTGLNVVGLRRRGLSNDSINQLKEVYRLLYRSEFNTSQALEQIRSGFEMTPEIHKVVSFIETSSRGIVS